jgi:F-type H+-transporting ATPase subunit delta
MTFDLEKAIQEVQADVSEQRLARVYAEALLNLTERDQCVDEVHDELRQLTTNVIGQVQDLQAFLSGGTVGRRRRADVLKQAFADRAHPIVVQFLLVLNEHDRLTLLALIVRELGELIDMRNRRFPVLVRSAAPLADDQRQRLVSNLRDLFKLDPVLDVKVDPELLGGLIIRIGDWLFDGSVRNELENLRKQLMEKSSHEIQSGRDRFGVAEGN